MNATTRLLTADELLRLADDGADRERARLADE